MKEKMCKKQAGIKEQRVLCDSLSYMCRCHAIKWQDTTSIIISVAAILPSNDLVGLIKAQHNTASVFGAVGERCAGHNKPGLEPFYSLCNESELHFVRHAGIHKYIIMNYTQGCRQVQRQTLWIEQFGSLVIITYGRRCRRSLQLMQRGYRARLCHSPSLPAL